jgi:hypothetical protein
MGNCLVKVCRKCVKCENKAGQKIPVEGLQGSIITYAFVALWLDGSWRTASSFSSSSLLRLDAGTDLEGSLSSMIYLEGMMPACGDVSWEPDLPGLL